MERYGARLNGHQFAAISPGVDAKEYRGVRTAIMCDTDVGA